jgi:hypothetical protein
MRILATLAGAAVLVVAGATTTTAAAAPAPADTAVRTDATVLAAPPAGCNPWLTTSWGQTCYEYEGDDQWVRDLNANGWAAVVHVQTNYGKNRYCVSLPAAQGWGECTFDHRETGCVRFRMYEERNGVTRNPTGWTLWHSIATGGFC